MKYKYFELHENGNKIFEGTKGQCAAFMNMTTASFLTFLSRKNHKKYEVIEIKNKERRKFIKGDNIIVEGQKCKIVSNDKDYENTFVVECGGSRKQVSRNTLRFTEVRSEPVIKKHKKYTKSFV